MSNKLLLKKFICLLLTAYFTYSINAQDKTVDSLQNRIEHSTSDTAKVNSLYALSDFNIDELYNLENAILFAQQGLELSKKTGYTEGQITGLWQMSYLQQIEGKTELAKQSVYDGLDIIGKYHIQNSILQLWLYRRLGIIYEESNPDSAIYYFTKEIQLAQNLHLPAREADASGSIGYALLFLGNYPQALKITLKGVQIAENVKDPLLEEALYRYLGNVYFFQNDVRRSIHYYDTAESLIGKMTNDISRRAFCAIYISKARAYLKLGILDSALLYANLGYPLAKNGYYNSATARILNILGNIYEKMGSDSVSLSYFRRGILFSLSHNSNTAAIQTYNSLAQYFYFHKNADSSLWYARKAIGLIRSSHVLLDEPETYRILSEVYRSARNFDSTFKYLQLLQASKDSLLGMDKIEQMKFIEFGEEQQKIQQQATELAYKNRVKFYSLLMGIALLFIVAGLLWRTTRIKQKSYVQLKIQQSETDKQRENAEHTLIKLQATQSQLVQAEKMASLGELTAGIAHEIQNPLNFVNNFSEVNTELIEELQQEMNTGNLTNARTISDEIKVNEQKINHHGKRADAIVKGMLQHSRESKGQKELTDVNRLTDEYLRLSYQSLRTKEKGFHATLRTDFDEHIGKINIIPQDIGRVLLNLYSNAFYAVAEKKKQQGEDYEPVVTITTKRIGDKIEISVKDNGNGIPQRIVDKVFQPFFTTKPTGQGTGLGLSLSYDIIKAHGGEFSVETREGEFAEFIVQL
jgi:two-component system NtrC family sensor kinase